jgi:curved DNA-binding protein CbpA
LKKKYRVKVKELHPDRPENKGKEEMMKVVNNAKEALDKLFDAIERS